MWESTSPVGRDVEMQTLDTGRCAGPGEDTGGGAQELELMEEVLQGNHFKLLLSKIDIYISLVGNCVLVIRLRKRKTGKMSNIFYPNQYIEYHHFNIKSL